MNAPFHDAEAAGGKQPLTVLIAAPRGFCAGVDRAIEIVEKRSSGTARRSMSGTRSSTTNTSSKA
jgi:hypothetical protein